MRYAGTIIGWGFIVISAASNFLFAYSLARSGFLAFVYGAVGVLATCGNAYIPLRMLAAYDAGRTSVIAAGAALLPFCIMFSLASALGFAAAVREHGTGEQAGIAANHKIAQKQLIEAERAPRPDKKRIEELRNEIKRLNAQGAQKEADPQAAALDALGIADGRYWISLLFALLVEVGASLGLYIALADAAKPAGPSIPRSRA